MRARGMLEDAQRFCRGDEGAALAVVVALGAADAPVGGAQESARNSSCGAARGLFCVQISQNFKVQI